MISRKSSSNKVNFLLMVILSISSIIYSQEKRIFEETENQKTERIEWWTNARFGMFIHWGLYALPARHEWVMSKERLTKLDYHRYFEEFNPDLFNPSEWAKNAKRAGMKYVVITTKHHEGFSLFDSKFTDYKATKTAANRDLLKEFIHAFREEGIKIGFYYSLLDWHHPDFTIDARHPERPESVEPGKKVNEYEIREFTKLNRDRSFPKYRKFMFNQVRELLTNYGKIDILWLDYSYPEAQESVSKFMPQFSYPGTFGKGHKEWHSKELLKMVRELQPHIIINNRLDLQDYTDGYDFITPEQIKVDSLDSYRGETFESIQTFSGSWGYYRDEDTWKTNIELLDLLISSVGNGGNLMLNVGPTGRGEFDHRAIKALDSIEYWMHANSKSIYGATYAPSDYKVPKGTKLTYNPQRNKLYMFIYNYPENDELILPNYAEKIHYAQFLHDNSEIIYRSNGGKDLVLILPKNKPPFEIPVIELSL